MRDYRDQIHYYKEDLEFNTQVTYQGPIFITNSFDNNATNTNILYLL